MTGIMAHRRPPAWLSIDHKYLQPPHSDFIIALGICGDFLGILCTNIEIKRTPRPSTAVPDVLQPTPLQLATPHYSWIDRFPFPRMRDNLILLSHRLDLEDFFTDLFRMESFTLRKNADVWDVTAWEMCDEFREKWGYLFH